LFRTWHVAQVVDKHQGNSNRVSADDLGSERLDRHRVKEPRFNTLNARTPRFVYVVNPIRYSKLNLVSSINADNSITQLTALSQSILYGCTDVRCNCLPGLRVI